MVGSGDERGAKWSAGDGRCSKPSSDTGIDDRGRLANEVMVPRVGGGESTWWFYNRSLPLRLVGNERGGIATAYGWVVPRGVVVCVSGKSNRKPQETTP